jgi:outer membrane protein OmpA-like peptidoglycan-associated protein
MKTTVYKPLKLAFALFLASTISSSLAADANYKQSLFKEANSAIELAKAARADILAPKSYQEAMKSFNNANEAFNDGDDLSDIREDIQQTIASLKKAVAATKLAEVTLTAAIQARSDADLADAKKYATSLWNEAEESFASAAKRLESKRLKSAQYKAKQAQAEYRTAELAAIKANYLDETRGLLEKAKKAKAHRFAEKTYNNAKDLLVQAEKALNGDRYDTDLPRRLARQAKYEAKHAIYISKQVRAVDDDDITLEDLYLSQEKPIITIAETADIAAELDEGFEKTTTEVVNYLVKLRSMSQSLSEDVSLRKQRIFEMEQQIELLESKLGGATAESKALKLKAQNEAKIEQTFAQIEQMFDRKQAEVFRQGNNVILRLVGLNFRVGQSTIESENFALLKQVKNAITLFQRKEIIVEGHTDSHGSDATNLTLSIERANAVREYLLSNMEISAEMVKSAGYGETRPVANNETTEGRRKNRRIDIVIKPQF